MNAKTTVALLAGIFFFPGAVRAQEEGDRRLDREIERLKRDLNLSDEQAGKVRSVLKDLSAKEQKLREERSAKVKELLDDGQKKKYDELQSRRGRGGGRQGGRRGGMFGRGPSGEELRRRLGLTDEQVEKINEAQAEMREAMRDLFTKFREEGFDREKMREEMQKMRAKVAEKIKGFLTEEQRKKYDEAFGEGRNGGRTRGRRSPEEVVKSAMDALKIEGKDEAEVVRLSVKKVVDARRKLGEFDRRAREEAAKGLESSEDEIAKKIRDLRARRKAVSDELGETQKGLREIVSRRQELILIRLGILE